MGCLQVSPNPFVVADVRRLLIADRESEPPHMRSLVSMVMSVIDDDLVRNGGDDCYGLVAERIHRTSGSVHLGLWTIRVLMGIASVAEYDRLSSYWLVRSVIAFIDRNVSLCSGLTCEWLLSLRGSLSRDAGRSCSTVSSASGSSDSSCRQVGVALDDCVTRLFSAIPNELDRPGLYAFGYPGFDGLKIGMSRTGVKSRLCSMFSEASRVTMPVDPVVYRLWSSNRPLDDETLFHRALTDCSIRGLVNGREWFRVDLDLVDCVADRLGLVETWRLG